MMMRINQAGDDDLVVCVHRKVAAFLKIASFLRSYDYGKLRQAECAVDEIRTRYGNDAIKRARFVSAPDCADPYAIDHMNGGISRERRTVDYHKENIL